MPFNWFKSTFAPRKPRRTAKPSFVAKFYSELLEDRVVLAANFATGVGFGENAIVRLIDGNTNQEITSFAPYGPAADGSGFLGGVQVALADVTGDGTADLITASGIVTGVGSGSGSHVKVFDGVTFTEVRSFFAFAGFNGPVNVAAGDLDADGQADIVVSIADLDVSHVKAISGRTGEELTSFFAFDQGFVNGVNVAVADVNADGKDDIVVGARSNGNGHIKVYQDGIQETLSEFAYSGFLGVTTLGAGDATGDGRAEIVTGASVPGAHLKEFNGTTGEEVLSFFAFAPGFLGEAKFGFTTDTNGNGGGDLVVGATGTQQVTIFDGQTGAPLSSFSINASLNGGIGVSDAAVPIITSGTIANVAENTTAVTTVTATDANAGDTLTYSILPGADALKFQIDANTGVLTFIAAPDFETPTDVGTDNVYNVTVRVSDGTLSTDQTLAVTVTAVNDNNPVITSNGGGSPVSLNVAENTTAVTTVVATDADLPTQTLTYSIIGGDEGEKFQINANTGVLTFLVAPDFEAPTDDNTDNGYTVIVRVSDGTLSTDQEVRVFVTAVNDNTPVITSNGGGSNGTQNVAENSTAVTTVTATDADAGSTLTYSIIGGDEGDKFQIDANTGVLTFLVAPDFETPTDDNTDNGYTVIVRVSDGTLSTDQEVRVFVTAVNENPVVTTSTDNISYFVDAPPVIIDAAITVTDPDIGDTMVGATVSSPDYANGDQLDFSGEFAGFISVTGTFDAGTGVLTFTGSATPADYQTLLRSVRFATNVPAGVTHSFTFTVDDGNDTGSASRNVTVIFIQ